MDLTSSTCTSRHEESDYPIIRQFLAQQEYMNNYLITDENFVHVPEHNDPVAVQDNSIIQEYLYTAINNYISSFGLTPVALAIFLLPTAAAGNSLHHS